MTFYEELQQQLKELRQMADGTYTGPTVSNPKPIVVQGGFRRKRDAKALAQSVGGVVAIESRRTWVVWRFPVTD